MSFGYGRDRCRIRVSLAPIFKSGEISVRPSQTVHEPVNLGQAVLVVARCDLCIESAATRLHQASGQVPSSHDCEHCTPTYFFSMSGSTILFLGRSSARSTVQSVGEKLLSLQEVVPARLHSIGNFRRRRQRLRHHGHAIVYKRNSTPRWGICSTDRVGKRKNVTRDRRSQTGRRVVHCRACCGVTGVFSSVVLNPSHACCRSIFSKDRVPVG
jgi:hypothetical protein